MPVLLVVMAVLLGAGAALLGYAGSTGRTAARELEAEQAFHAAEAGVQVVVQRALKRPGLDWWNSVRRPLVLDGNGLCPGCRGFTATVQWNDCPDTPCTALTVTSEGQAGSPDRPARYRLTATVTYDPVTQAVQVRYNQ